MKSYYKIKVILKNGYRFTEILPVLPINLEQCVRLILNVDEPTVVSTVLDIPKNLVKKIVIKIL